MKAPTSAKNKKVKNVKDEKLNELSPKIERREMTFITQALEMDAIKQQQPEEKDSEEMDTDILDIEMVFRPPVRRVSSAPKSKPNAQQSDYKHSKQHLSPLKTYPALLDDDLLQPKVTFKQVSSVQLPDLPPKEETDSTNHENPNKKIKDDCYNWVKKSYKMLPIY